MARYSGRNMQFYVSLDGTAAASPVSFLSEYELSASSDQIEVTAGGDSNKTYVPGLPDFSGSVSGFHDYADSGATDALWLASRDGIARGFYLYPNRSDTTRAFYGTAYFDWSHSAGVGSAGTVSSSITAAGNIYRK